MSESYFHQSRSAESGRTAGLDLVDWIFLASFSCAVTAGPWLREAGPLGFGVFALICLCYAAVRNTLFYLDWFSGFTAVGIIYVLLSYIDIFPQAWTIYYNTDSILMQSSFVWTFIPMLRAFEAFFFRVCRAGRMPIVCAVAILLNISIAPLLKWDIAPIHMQEQGPMAMVFSNIMNSEAIFLLSIAYMALQTKNRIAGYAGIVMVIFSAVFSLSFQIMIVFLFLQLMQLRLPSRWIFPAMLIGFGAMALASLMVVDMAALAEIDRNSAIRGYLWLDAIELWWSSYGVGVGFGRELVQNIYISMNIMQFYDDMNILLGGVHNSFLSMFARLGTIGGVLFMLAFFKSAWPSSTPGPLREVAYFAYFTAYVSCWVNVAVESPLAAIGAALLLGFVLAARGSRNGAAFSSSSSSSAAHV